MKKGDNDDYYIIQCPYCDFEIEAVREYVIQNDLLFCGNCTKAFEIAHSKFVDLEDFEED